eukprot:g2787.t1
MEDHGDVPGVRVTVRLRPLNTKELGEGQTVGWQYNNKTILDDTGQGKKSFNFDSVLGPDSNNDQAYEDIAAHLVEKSLDGYNTTVFAYGQTGSGKTWTMMGDDEGNHPGIIPRALDSMFKRISADKDRNYLLRCSFLELYNENINDLLNEEETGQNLSIIAEDPAKGAIIGGLREEIIGSVADGMALIHLGTENRKVACTAMNARSSRSHTIFRVVVEATKTEEALERERKLIASVEEDDDEGSSASAFKSFGTKASARNTVVSYLNLVDLAGSERQRHTKTEGKQLKEGAAINKSLLALGAVIGALSNGMADNKKGEASGGDTDNREGTRSRGRRGVKMKKGRSKAGAGKTHIPYRNSKLTRILRQSLGGNTFTSIVIAMSPAPMYKEESRSSLKFGRMCKKIKNKVKQNNVADDKTLLKQYKLQIAKLKLALEEEQKTVNAAARNGVGDSAEAIEAQKAAEEESKSLRKKLSILQAMYLGGATSNTSTRSAQESAGGLVDDKDTSKFWTKLKSGVKSRFFVDSSKNESAAMREKNARERAQLAQYRNELNEAKTKYQEVEFQLAQLTSKFAQSESRFVESDARAKQLEIKLAKAESVAKSRISEISKLTEVVEKSKAQISLRMREKNTTKRETALVSEEARQLRENEMLNEAKASLRKDEHAFKLKQVHQSAAVRVQTAVRKMLRKRAAQKIKLCEKLQKELDKRERDVGELEAQQKSRAADLSALKVRLELQEASMKRDMKTLHDREMAFQRRTEDLLRSEERHREIQLDIEKRDLRSVEREEESRQACLKAADRERHIEDTYADAQRMLSESERKQKLATELHAKCDERNIRIVERERLVALAEKNLETEKSHLQLRAEALDKQQEAMNVEAQRVRKEWDNARILRAENEKGDTRRVAEKLELEQARAALRAEQDLQKEAMEAQLEAIEEERAELAA